MNVAFVGLLILLAAAMFEAGSMQREVGPCNRVIRLAEDFESHSGRYPRGEEMAALEPVLSALCGYQRSQNSFVLAVNGHWFNPQVYRYDSGRKRWRWE